MIKQLLSKVMVIAACLIPTIGFSQSVVTINVGPGSTNTYAPANVSCTVGDTIQFVWVSGSHPTQSNDGTTIPLQTLDGTAGNGSVYKVKMTAVGTVPYFCTAHGPMTGVITVNAALSNTPFLVDNFEYTLGDTLSNIGASNWKPIATVSTVNKIPVVAGLSYLNSAASGIGNAALIKNTGQDIGKSFPVNYRDGSIYTSMLINVTSAGTGDYFFAYFDSLQSGTNYRGRLFIKNSGSGFRVGISKSGAVGVAGFNSTDLTFGTTYMVVVKYTIVSGATNDLVEIFINPTLGAAEPAASAQAVASENDMPISSTIGVGAIALRQGGGTPAPFLTIDGIQSGRTWASVTATAVLNPKVNFTATVQSINEDAGTATVTVNLTDANTNATSVDVVVKGGTATAGADYTFTSQTVTFPANSTVAQNITIPITDDMDPETDETIILALRNATNGAEILADSIHTITINANDLTSPIINFVAPHALNKLEGESHVFSVSITNSNASATGFKVFVKATSTASSADYSGIPETGLPMSFPGGTSSNQSENINIINDLIAEGAETIVLVLRDATNSAVIGSDSIITITIPQNDQPAVLHFTPTSATVNENAGTVSGTVMVMGVGSPNPTSFDVVVKGGTATLGSDYTYVAATYTVAANEDSMVSIPYTIINDNLVEADETIQFVIRNATNGATITTDSIFTVTIKSDDIKFREIAELKVNNANGISLLLDSMVHIRGVVYGVDMQGSPTSMQYTVIDPTGGVGMFRSSQNLPPVITMVPEEGDSVNIYGKVGEFNGLTQVNMDSIILISKGNALRAPKVVTKIDESSESMLVRLNGFTIIDTLQKTASGKTFRIVNGTDSTDLRIDADVADLMNFSYPAKFDVIGIGGQFDNTNPKNSGYQILPRYLSDIVVYPTVKLDSASYRVQESGGARTVKVLLSSPAIHPTTVSFAITGGTATLNTDYTVTIPNPVTFAIGETEKSIVFNIIDDNIHEANETINLAISSPVNATLGTPATATLTIIDNDPSGLNNNRQAEFKLFPNPASSSFNVSSDLQIQNVMVYNMVGQQVINVSVNANSASINTNELTTGIYTVIVQTNNGLSSEKLMIK